MRQLKKLWLLDHAVSKNLWMMSEELGAALIVEQLIGIPQMPCAINAVRFVANIVSSYVIRQFVMDAKSNIANQSVDAILAMNHIEIGNQTFVASVVSSVCYVMIIMKIIQTAPNIAIAEIVSNVSMMTDLTFVSAVVYFAMDVKHIMKTMQPI